MIESRKSNDRLTQNLPTQGSALPRDFLKMVEDVFSKHFSEGLQSLSKTHQKPRFSASGMVFCDEIFLTVSLLAEGNLGATTVHSSMDFDPKASKPKADELLGLCVDATGTVFAELFGDSSPKFLEALMSESLHPLEQIPFEWSPFEIEKRTVFVKVDKSNPMLENLTDEWLKKNDPEYLDLEKKSQKEAEELFFVDPRKKH